MVALSENNLCQQQVTLLTNQGAAPESVVKLLWAPSATRTHASTEAEAHLSYEDRAC